MMRGPDRQVLLDVYANHPLREDTILARIARQRGTLDDITELDLAHDSATEITDQNHVGGVASVVRLASLAGVRRTSRVLDLGAGLGGSARCLAYLFGCRVEGVELSPLRFAQAVSLTARVHLDDLVTFTCGDMLAVPLAAHAFDVVWGQGSWLHIADANELCARAAAALKPGGCVAFEEAVLARAPDDGREGDLVAALEQSWNGRFLSVGAWSAALATASLETTAVEDVTPDFVGYFQRLDTIARTAGAGQYNAHEMQAFTSALALAAAGVVRYARIVARGAAPRSSADRSG